MRKIQPRKRHTPVPQPAFHRLRPTSSNATMPANRVVDGSGTAPTLAANVPPPVPKLSSQRAKSDALSALGDSPRCHLRKSAPSTSPSSSKSAMGI